MVGDVMVDNYIFGKCERISPEAPVQVVEVEKEEKVLGGAGNVVRNLLAFDAEVGFLSVVGDDEAGEWIKKKLKGINSYLFTSNRPTTKKSRIIASHQQIIRIDKEEKKRIEFEEEFIERFKEVVGEYDLVLLSDYDKGVLTPKVSQEIIKTSPIKVFVDPKRDFFKFKGATLLKPNKKEASLATQIEIKDRESLIKAGKKLKEELNLQTLIITLSEEGMAVFEEDEVTFIPTVAKEVFDVTGAGDTVLAALGYGVASGKDLIEAVKFANTAAGVVVGKVGTAVATLEEIEKYFKEQEPIKSVKELKRIVSKAKKEGKRVVFTNGCFDILHLGHIKYLQKAKELGDILIVGVNSDESVKRLKGKERPINPQYDRAYLVGNLKAVDYVTIFEEDTPYNLIKELKPDILVKGKDYEGKEVVGSDLVKETYLIEFVKGKSTTSIIERIKGC